MDGKLLIAVLGVLLASLSLGWQAATYALTGGRVKVTLRVGAAGHRGTITGKPNTYTPAARTRLTEQGYTQPIVAVTVVNVGRQPVTVDRWSLKHPLGVSLSLHGGATGPPLPHRLDVGAPATWTADLNQVLGIAETTEAVFGKSSVPQRLIAATIAAAIRDAWRRYRHGAGIVGVVQLVDGRTKRSRDAIRR